MRGFLMIPVMLCVIAGMCYYLSYRIYQGFASFFAGMRFWPVLLVVSVLFLILILGFGRALMPFSKEVKRVLGVVSGYCMGIVIYLLLFTVVSDVVLLVPRLMKLSFTTHHLYRGFVTIGVLALTAVTCIYGVINARQIDKVSYNISLSNRKDISDMKIVMISDLHLGAIGSEDRLEKIVEKINAEEPDVVCIAGDFFDTDFASIQDPERALKTLQKLQATYGVYASLGNHDGGETFRQMVDYLEKAKIHLLKDGYTVIDDRMVLVGRLDAAAIGGYGDLTRKPLSDVFTREDSSMPVIVLDHNPAHIHEYSTDADVILCGHTHKGQIFPANIITNLMYTVDYGYYRKDSESPHVIVSSGVGTWGMPMRVASDCEIVTIHIS